MKNACFIIFFSLINFICLHGQDSSRIFKFQEVGWTIAIPKSFRIVDSAENAEINQRGQKAIEKSMKQQVDINNTKTLFTALKGKNYLSATLTHSDAKNQLEWEVTNHGINDILYQTMKDNAPNAQVDTANSTTSINGRSFDDFFIKLSVNGKIIASMHMLSRLENGYDFGISYVYFDEETGNEIKKIIERSSFYDIKIAPAKQ